MNKDESIVEMWYSVQTPRVETNVSDSGHMLTIRVMKGKTELFIIKSEVSKEFNIDKILNTLELATGSRKLKKVQRSKSDLMFQKFMDAQAFKNYYVSNPRNLKIVLFEPVKLFLVE